LAKKRLAAVLMSWSLSPTRHDRARQHAARLDRLRRPVLIEVGRLVGDVEVDV